MKKKISLSGINAKTALAIVALSGALLTGCYKDDGLDVSNPAGTVTLPAPTYTITGTVVDAETKQPISDATVKGAGADITVTNGSFTIAAEAKTYNLEVVKEGYDNGIATVEVKPLKAGQAAVYPVTIFLAPKMDGKYTLKFAVVDENFAQIEDATISLYEGNLQAAPQAVKDNQISNIAGNQTYLAKVEKEGYITQIVRMELPAIRANATKEIDVVLTKELTKMVTISGYLKANGAPWSNTVIEIYYDGKRLDTQNGPAYSFSVPADLFQAKTRAEGTEKEAKFDFNVIDGSGKEYKFSKTITIDGNGQTSEGSTNFDINIKAKFTAIPDLDQKNDPTVIPVNHKNDSEWACTLSFTWNYYEGQEITDPTFDVAKLSAAGVKEGTVMYNTIVDAYKEIASSYTTIGNNKQKETLTIPALTLLESITVNHYYTTGKIVLTDLTVEVGVENITTEQDIIDKMKDNYSAYKKADSSDYKMKTSPIGHGHSHGHGHGHGDDPNAGGGIVEAE